MGLIRKSLAVGTLGVVNGSSKKQRVAQATLEAIRGPSPAELARLERQVRRLNERATATPAPVAAKPLKPFPREGDWLAALRRWWW